LVLGFVLRDAWFFLSIICFFIKLCCSGLLLFFLLLLLWFWACFCRCARGFKLEFTVSDFSPFLVGGCCIYLRASKHKGNFYGFIFNRLKWSANINAQLTQFLYIVIINKMHLFLLRAIENNSHYRLSSPHGAVRFDMHLINSYSLSFGNKGIKNIFTEIFTLNNHLFLFCVPL